MKIICDSCGHNGEASKVEVRDGAVFVTCGACGTASSLDAGPTVETTAAPESTTVTPSPLPPPEEGLPPVKCPKCANRQEDDYACHKCGLVFEMVADGRTPWEEAATPAEARAIAQASELWADLELHRADPARHDAFVEFTRAQGISSWAAMRYRHWLADYPSDALARAAFEQAVSSAQALANTMQPSRKDAAGSVKRVRAVLLAFVTVILVLLLVAAARVFTQTGL